jgi:hypothetical protein
MSADVSAATDKLKRAGFPVSYASRDVASNGSMPPYSHYYSAVRTDDFPEAYVDLSRVARSEDACGQSSYVDRANYIGLTADYPDVWAPIGYANVDGLGAFVRDIASADQDGLVDILCSLATDYPSYDDERLSLLEQTEITEQWQSFGAFEFGRELPEDVQTAWEALSESDQTEMFWTACEASGYYPEAASAEILWSYAYERAAPVVADKLRTAPESIDELGLVYPTWSA